MNYIIDCTKKDINFDFENIIIGRKINSKFYLYYQENEYKDIKDIHIKMPKIRNIYKLGQSKFNQENVPIYPNYDLTNNFINFIKYFEKNLLDCFIQKIQNVELNSLINKKNNIFSIKVNLDESINYNINLNDIKFNNEMQMILKINYIWFKETTNTLGLNISLFQIFSTENINISNIPKNIIKPIIENNNIKNETDIIVQEQPPIIVRPSLADISSALKKLKPLSNN